MIGSGGTSTPVVEAIPVYSTSNYQHQQQQQQYNVGNNNNFNYHRFDNTQQQQVMQHNNKFQQQKKWRMIICGAVAVCIILIIIIVVAVVLISNHCSVVELGKEIRGEGDHVGLIFSACPSKQAYTAFTNAASRWSAIVKDSQFTSVQVPFSFDTRTTFCGNLKKVEFEKDVIFDHLVIIAETTEIDGPQGILAGAGPCQMFLNPPAKQIPLLGVMIFDTADLGDIEDDGTLEKVILHEMAHVLGFGTLWPSIREGGLVAETDTVALLPNPIFDENHVARPSNIPRFFGSNAVNEFNILKGDNSTTFVPVEDGKNELGVEDFFDPSAGEGEGSIDGHWKKTTFGDELMTFSIDASAPSHPLSRTSLAALEDAGYKIDYARADSYNLPSNSVGRSANLRASTVKVRSHYDLTGDARLFKGPNDDLKKDLLLAV